MKTNFRHLLIAVLLFLTNIGLAQNSRMTRDIEVAENILATLINQGSNNRLGNSVEGTYIDGHGVMFTIGGSGGVFNFNFGNAAVLSGEGKAYSLKGEVLDKIGYPDSLNQVAFANMKNVMKTFITDYAQLLSQLKPNEKILLRYSPNRLSSRYVISGSAQLFFSDSDEEKSTTPKELTAEVVKSAIDDYKSGKISQKQLEERIKFSEKTSTAKKDSELELLGSIFNRLYQGDLSKTFHMLGQPNYEKIEGLGAIFDMRFGAFAKGLGNNRLYYFDSNDRIRELRKKREEVEPDEEEEVNMEERYDAFMDSFKENVIEYGRTVKNLPANELLVFKVELSSCPDCEIPRKVEVSVKKSVLEDYDKNKISLEQAIEQITVKTTEKQD